MNASVQTIRDSLALLRRKLLWLALGEVVCFTVALGCVVLLFALPAGALLSPWLGRGIVGVGLLILVAIAWRWALKPIWSRRSDLAVARWLESRDASLKSGVITAIQTADEVADGQRTLPYSRQLAHDASEQAARALSHREFSSLIDTRRIRRLSVLAAMSLVLLTVVVVSSPRIAELGRRALVEGVSEYATWAGLKRRVVDVAVGDLSLQIDPPNYAGLKSRTVSRSSGDIQALTGSTVTVTGSALFPAARAFLTLESDPDGRWPVGLSKAGLVSATLRVGDRDRYRFVVVTPDEQVIEETGWKDVVAVPDAIPEVKLLLPESDVEVHDTDSVAIMAEAVDDRGLDHLTLVIEATGREPVRRLLRPANGRRTIRAGDALAVKALGLNPGESLTIYVEASDQNTVSGPGIGRSASRRLSLYSPEKEHERLLGLIEKVLDHLIDVLADRLESPVERKNQRRLFKYTKYHQAIVGRSALVLNQLHTIHRHAGSDPLASTSFRATLKRVVDALEEIQNQEVSLLGRIQRQDSVMARPSVLVSLLESTNQQGVMETEKAIFALKRLIDQSRQEDILGKGRELLELQNSLGDLLSQFEKSGNPQMLRDAAAQLNRLESNLRKMQAQLEKLADRVPYENQNPVDRPSTTHMDMSDLRTRIQKARELIKQGKVAEAKKLLEALHTDTQRLMASLQNQFQTGQPMTAEAMKATADFQRELSGVTDRQQTLFDRTGTTRKKLDQRVRKALERKIESLVKEAEALKKGFSEVSRKGLHKEDRKTLERETSSAGRLKPEIEATDFAEAAARAERLHKAAQELVKEIKATEERELEMTRSRAQKAAMKALQARSKEASELAKKLRELSKKMDRTNSPDKKESADMKRLGKRQGGLSKRVTQLEKSLKKLDKQVPGLERKLQGALKQARKAMDAASKQLGQGKPRGARGHQRDALDRLKQASEGLAKQLKPPDAGSGQAVAGPKDPREKMAIPHKDDARLPRKFREALLKAMKERAPKRFRKEIKRYYEELVK